ncbi:hypothetical protein H5410_032035 [Solanum commersonii]|uniref:Uncharacterized protein n=1 Tax=Solanum commersonii TaxID=4109 RepID=A0A9J5YK06_SOLCO|nr:hypothetical protein H5410_032035 [Solanum commersonii]
MIPGVIFWCLWTEMNLRCSDGISTPNHSLKARCLLMLFSWVKLTPVFSTEQIVDFVSSLVLISSKIQQVNNGIHVFTIFQKIMPMQISLGISQ